MLLHARLTRIVDKPLEFECRPLFLAATIGLMYLGPSFAMTQALVSPRMRAVSSAILLFTLNLIGMGLGPYFVGVASDLLEPRWMPWLGCWDEG